MEGFSEHFGAEAVAVDIQRKDDCATDFDHIDLKVVKKGWVWHVSPLVWTLMPPDGKTPLRANISEKSPVPLITISVWREIEYRSVSNRFTKPANGGNVLARARLRNLGNSLRIECKTIYGVRTLVESRTTNLYAQLAIPSLCRFNLHHRSPDFLEILDLEVVNKANPRPILR